MAEIRFDNTESTLRKDGIAETTTGTVSDQNLPIIMFETLDEKLFKLTIVIALFVVVMIVIMYFVWVNVFKKKACMTSPIHLPEPNIKKVRTPLLANTRIVKLTNNYRRIPVEHIVLVDQHDNIIDIDIKTNYFVERFDVGRGECYKVDLGSSRFVKEVVVMMNPDITYADRYNLYNGEGSSLPIKLELFDLNGFKSWEYTGIMSDKENRVYVENVRIIKSQKIDKLYDWQLLKENGPAKYKLQENEELLASLL